jgi:glycosyltransferase involved in cell wall biosynthesis
MNNKNPLISVGIPAYNSDQYIRESIESILDQTYENFELIIADNASTDGTQVICEEFAARDRRVKYTRNEANIGASGNYNAVFNLSHGKYFKWASSNDYCAPTFLERCVNSLESDPQAVLAFPRTRLFSNNMEDYFDYQESLNTASDNPRERMLHIIDNIRLNNIMNGVIRSDALRKTALIIPFYASDSCLMSELALHGKFLEVPEYLFYRRMDEESSTSMQDESTRIEHYQPNSKKPMRFQNWKINLYYFAAARRSGMPPGELLLTYKELVRRMNWHRKSLLADFLFWKPASSNSPTDWKAL